jgi:hypothetical protein
VPLCLDAVEYYSEERWSLWQDELFALDKLPFPTDESTLFVAFSAPAEVLTFLALDWHCRAISAICSLNTVPW